jgi:hypothetical protein
MGASGALLPVLIAIALGVALTLVWNELETDAWRRRGRQCDMRWQRRTEPPTSLVRRAHIARFASTPTLVPR